MNQHALNDSVRKLLSYLNGKVVTRHHGAICWSELIAGTPDPEILHKLEGVEDYAIANATFLGEMVEGYEYFLSG